MRTFVLAGVAACASFNLARADPNGGAQPPAASASAQSWVRSQLSSWPESSRILAAQLVSRYGRPNESTAQRLTWYDNAPWKRTTLYKEGPLHNFPKAHHDILEQTVAYRVPPDKIGDLIAYNGSLVVDRTRGELSVHCDSEQANTLTLNLADDIVKGERSADQALAYHAQVVRGVQIGEPETYPQKLRFTAQPSTATADPGEEAELLRHLEH
ncbi:MAG TPA: hypothetical protein VMG11_08415 [Steroidobacteraceae bacterium]|nr:hypothetical protein [Steroidobacteraceae bacterium]